MKMVQQDSKEVDTIATECTKVAHRHSLANFHCRPGYRREFRSGSQLCPRNQSVAGQWGRKGSRASRKVKTKKEKKMKIVEQDSKEVDTIAMGKCEGSRLVGGTRLVVFPRCLTPYRPKNTTSRDPYPPSSRDPPFRPGPLPPSAPLWEGQGARGPGSRGGPGSWLS